MIIEITIQIINCLQFVHFAGYTHNDIKPSNIMIDVLKLPDSNEQYVRVNLIDFGFAKKYTDNGQPDNHIVES